jgi:DNA-binding Xre family transcriptional regulator
MNENINFKHLKTLLKSNDIGVTEIAGKVGTTQQGVSAIINGNRQPKTDLIAKLCFVLQCYPSEIVSFEGYDVNREYFKDEDRYKLPSAAKGELTYMPLWYFLDDYLEEHKGKTANDLFDQIEPPRRLNGTSKLSEEYWKKAVAVKYGEGYKSERKNRTDYSKGLPAATRVKLRNDRPLNLSVIYEICKKLGCTIDWVLSYK